MSHLITLKLDPSQEHAREALEQLAGLARDGAGDDSKRAAKMLDGMGITWRVVRGRASQASQTAHGESSAAACDRTPSFAEPSATQAPDPFRGPSLALRWLFVGWCASILVRWLCTHWPR